MLPQLRQFWDTIRAELANENSYKASIGSIRLKLSELQESDLEAQELKLKKQLPDGWEDINRVLYYQRLPFVSEVIQTELINQHHDDPLVGHFGIDKTKDLIGCKYYWPSLRKNIEAYVKGSQTQTLWRPVILACTNSSMERPYNRFHHWTTNFNRLKR